MDARTLVGKEQSEAIVLLTVNETKWRYSVIDGVGQMGTTDAVADRVNLEVQDGVVVAVTFG